MSIFKQISKFLFVKKYKDLNRESEIQQNRQDIPTERH